MSEPLYTSLNQLLDVEASLLRQMLPRDRAGDRIFGLIEFVRVHNRLPQKVLRFNDYLFHMKTGDEIVNPLRVFVTDKELVKIYVKGVVGDRHNVPTIDVLRSPEALDGYRFPDDCCIKPTHMSGRVAFRRNGGPVDLDKIRGWFTTNFYDLTREANYRHLSPKVIVEPIVFGDTNVNDYKFICHEGIPRLLQVDFDRRADHSRKFFDRHFVEQDFALQYKRYTGAFARPRNLARMFEVAAALAKAFSFVRIDLYSDGDECYVGEITNCHGNASERFLPASTEDLASGIVFG